MKVIVRGNLIDISLVYNITDIVGYREITDEFFIYAENPSFVIHFVGSSSIIIQDNWISLTNKPQCYRFSYEKHFPMWKESYEKLKKTREELIELWLGNQTEIPIIN